LSLLYDFLAVFILSVSPISEARGAIIYGILAGLEAEGVFAISVLGNMLIAAVLWASLGRLASSLRKRAGEESERNSFLTKIARLYCLYEAKVSVRVQPYTKKYGALGLAAFVAIPLPVTGAWTASIAAFALGIKGRLAFASILIGVFISGVIVLAVTLPVGQGIV